MTHGSLTGQFGVWLTTFVRQHALPLRVFYDHGDSEQANVGKIQGFVGSEATRETILTEVDVMVVDLSGDIKMLVEVEDRAVMAPKKLIGVALANLLCPQFSFGSSADKRLYSVVSSTKLVLVGVQKEKGYKNKQLTRVIIPRLQDLQLPPGAPSMTSVCFIFEATIEAAIDKVKNAIPELLR